MNVTTLKLCIWSGVVMGLFWLVGFAAFAGFMPPPAPGLTARQIVQMFQDNTTSIRLGLVLVTIASALLAPFCAAISVYLKHIEGTRSPITYAQLVLAACLILEFIFPLLILQGIAYRTRPDELALAMDDTAWLMFVGIVSTAATQVLLIGAAILQDRSRAAILPRWLGYVNVWTALTLCISNVIFFVKDGPLAWNGAFSWWLVLAVFGVWMVAMTVEMSRATSRLGERSGVRDDTVDLLRRLELIEAEVALSRSTPDPIDRALPRFPI